MPRTVTYRRKRPEPRSIPKGTLLVDVSNLWMESGFPLTGPLSLGVALVPGHELDKNMPVQTRWVHCKYLDSSVAQDCVVAEFKERLVLSIPDESVANIGRAMKDRNRSEGGAESLLMQVRVIEASLSRAFSSLVSVTWIWKIDCREEGKGTDWIFLVEGVGTVMNHRARGSQSVMT